MMILQGISHLFYLHSHALLCIMWHPDTFILIICKTNSSFRTVKGLRVPSGSDSPRHPSSLEEVVVGGTPPVGLPAVNLIRASLNKFHTSVLHLFGFAKGKMIFPST